MEIVVIAIIFGCAIGYLMFGHIVPPLGAQRPERHIADEPVEEPVSPFRH